MGRRNDMGWIMDLVERSNCIREGNDTHAMFPLVPLLSRGGEGVEVDVPRVLDLSSDKCNES